MVKERWYICLFAFVTAWFRKGSNVNREKIKVLFIGGYGRSGSTLLDRMLGQMEGFFSAGELRYIWDRSFAENQLCGCGKPFKKCAFWSTVIDETSFDGQKAYIDTIRALKHAQIASGISHLRVCLF